MVVEVNKLITNALILDGGIYLPNIGSITIETTTPKSENAAPTRDIIFKEGEEFKSLISVISERGNCTLQQGEQVYKRWKEIVTEGDTVTIFGIGKITDGKFTSTTQMYNKLNPVQTAQAQTPKVESKPGEQPEPIKKPEPKPAPAPKATPKKRATIQTHKKGKGKYAVAAVVAIAAAIGIGLFFTSIDKDVTPVTVEQKVVAEAELMDDSTTVEEITTPTPNEMVEATQAPATKRREININDEPTEILNQALMENMSSTPKYKVVFGVYSSSSNAGRTIAKVLKNTSGDELDIRAYNYGADKYLLTIFESNSASECSTFKNSQLGKSISDDLWIYERK